MKIELLLTQVEITVTQLYFLAIDRNFMNQQLFLKLEEFYVQLQLGHYDHPLQLAQTLEALADEAWDAVDELYQPSLLIP